MELIIHSWKYDTEELSRLPVFETRLDGRAGPVLRDGGRLALAYVEAGYSAPVLAGRLGCSAEVARRALGWYGIVPQKPLQSFSPHAGSQRPTRRFPVLNNPAQLRALYAEHGTQARMAAAIGCSPSLLREYLVKHGIRRPRVAAPEPEPKREPLTRARLRALVAQAYLGHDRCPPDCPGRGECLEPQGECIWYSPTNTGRALVLENA